MARDKTPPERSKPTRERVLDAAERLLGQGDAAFSMRDLAEEAGVSFATPFNQFGGKSAIMLALSARRIDAMQLELAKTSLPAGAVGRVLAAVDIATAVMLRAPAVNRAVMASISAPADQPGRVAARSGAYWAEALGEADGLAPEIRTLARAALPGQLAVAFRGALSFWTAGEFSDGELGTQACAAAAATLLGFVAAGSRAELLALLDEVSSPKPADRV